MNKITDKLNNNDPIINGFEIKKKFRIKIRIEDLKNIKQSIINRWLKLFNSY